jgi:hypothetical protein
MANKITKQDIELLKHISGFKILTVKQLEAISRRSQQAIRRRLRVLLQEGFVEKKMRGFGRAKGRPEEITFLTERGAELLHSNGTVKKQYSALSENALWTLPLDHDLLLNWFHLYLIQIEQENPQLTVTGFSTNTTPSTQSILNSTFIPDGIFAITDKESSKTILFFLEVDMGSETVASTDRNQNDFRQKVLNYQELFRSDKYKKCEKIFHSSFNGFRLLVMTNMHEVLKKLCRLVQEMSPSDFIWLTDQSQMFKEGLNKKIWHRGGKTSKPQESILGTKLIPSGA